MCVIVRDIVVFIVMNCSCIFVVGKIIYELFVEFYGMVGGYIISVIDEN